MAYIGMRMVALVDDSWMEAMSVEAFGFVKAILFTLTSLSETEE